MIEFFRYYDLGFWILFFFLNFVLLVMYGDGKPEMYKRLPEENVEVDYGSR